jgi:DNA topoisomerase-1
MDPYSISLDEARQLIKEKADRLLKTFTENPSMQVINGHFGPYISINKMNYKIPKTKNPETLTYEEANKIIEEGEKKREGKLRNVKRKV